VSLENMKVIRAISCPTSKHAGMVGLGKDIWSNAKIRVDRSTVTDLYSVMKRLF